MTLMSKEQYLESLRRLGRGSPAGQCVRKLNVTESAADRAAALCGIPVQGTD